MEVRTNLGESGNAELIKVSETPHTGQLIESSKGSGGLILDASSLEFPSQPITSKPVFFFAPDGQKRVLMSKKLQYGNFAVSVSMDYNELYSPAKRILMSVILFILLVLLASMAGMYLLLRPLTNRFLLREEELSLIIDEKTKKLELEIAERENTQKKLKKQHEILEKTEHLYRQLFENAPAGICKQDKNGDYITMNDEYARIFGYLNPQEMIKEIGNSKKIYANPEYFKRIMEQLEKVDRITEFEAESLHRDGTPFWTSQTVQAVRSSQGTINFYQAYIFDITEEKKLSEIKVHIDNIMHHDLRSPLTGIINLPEIIVSSGEFGEDEKNMLMTLSESGRKMLRLIDSSLSLYKLETGQYHIIENEGNILRDPGENGYQSITI